MVFCSIFSFEFGEDSLMKAISQIVSIKSQSWYDYPFPDYGKDMALDSQEDVYFGVAVLLQTIEIV